MAQIRKTERNLLSAKKHRAGKEDLLKRLQVRLLMSYDDDDLSGEALYTHWWLVYTCWLMVVMVVLRWSTRRGRMVFGEDDIMKDFRFARSCWWKNAQGWWKRMRIWELRSRSILDSHNANCISGHLTSNFKLNLRKFSSFSIYWSQWMNCKNFIGRQVHFQMCKTKEKSFKSTLTVSLLGLRVPTRNA